MFIVGLMAFSAQMQEVLDEMYNNKAEKVGRPNCYVILMFKILIHQQWYGLSDLEVERQMAISNSDGAICISRSVASELTEWLKTNGPKRPRQFKIGWFPSRHGCRKPPTVCLTTPRRYLLSLLPTPVF